jgi:hypothetical protein
MTRARSLVLSAIAALLTAAVAHAHHSAAASYDLSSTITVQGTVREFRFTSPHARIYLDVAGKDGVVERWLAEGANAAALRHIGWTADELKVGDRITLTGFPSRDGSPTLEWRLITRADGTQLGGGNNLPQERADLLKRLEAQRHDERARD